MTRPRPEGLDAPWVRKALVSMSKTIVFLYRHSGGRLGKLWLRGAPLCLLTTKGRQSGLPRTVPLVYLQDGERSVVVACHGGLPLTPQWYRNLWADPHASLQIGREQFAVVGRTLAGPEREALWPRLVQVFPDYADYETWEGRALPVVALEPDPDAR